VQGFESGAELYISLLECSWIFSWFY